MRATDCHKLFRAERARFAHIFPHVARSSLTIYEGRCGPHKLHCAQRDVAWTHPASGEVFLVRRALRLSRNNLVALLRHELAHVALPNLSEVETDALASAIGGRTIQYDRREIQTLGRGGPRPRHLHQ